MTALGRGAGRRRWLPKDPKGTTPLATQVQNSSVVPAGATLKQRNVFRAQGRA